MKTRTICVLGGSGFVGRHIVHRLAAAAYSVRVPTRNRERAKPLILLPSVDVIEADIHDPAQLDAVIAGADVVVNLVGTLHDDRNDNFATVHGELTRNILKSCHAHGVRRLLHMSTLNATADAPSAYLRSRGEAEALVQATMQSTDNHPVQTHQGLQATIFRPSVIFGHHDAFLNLFARLARFLPVLFIGRANARFQPVYVEDVAQIFVQSLTDTATFGRSFDICGPTVYTLRELVRYAAQTAGHRRPVIGLNHPLAYLQAWMLEKLPGRLLNRNALASMAKDSVCDSDFATQFGFRPTAVEAVAPDYLAPGAGRSRYRLLRRTAGR